MRIPVESLTPDALQAIVDEFISRDSTVTDAPFQVKRERMREALKRGDAYITYDADTRTTNIVGRDELIDP